MYQAAQPRASEPATAPAASQVSGAAPPVSGPPPTRWQCGGAGRPPASDQGALSFHSAPLVDDKTLIRLADGRGPLRESVRTPQERELVTVATDQVAESLALLGPAPGLPDCPFTKGIIIGQSLQRPRDARSAPCEPII